MADRKAVLVGGGITGVLTARELALAGWDVTVLEAEHVGAGSSSRTAAGIRQQFSTPGTVRGMRYSVGFYKDFARETEDGQSPIVQNGYLFLYDDPKQWAGAQRRVEMQHGAGLVEVEALEGDALFDRFPWVGRDAVIGGTHCPTDGFLHPHLVYNEGARRVRELGGRVLQNAPVTGAVTEGGRLVGVKTPKGVFEADLFFDCTNAWTRRLSRVLGCEELPVDPLKRYLWFLQREGAMTAAELQAMPLTICPSGLYCRPENRETLQMGKKHDTPPQVDFTYDDQDLIEPEFSHKGGLDGVPFELWMELAEVLPPIADFGGIQATTCGYYGTTPDHNPFLGYDRALGGLVHLVGFSGHGAMLGPFTALVAKSLAEAGQDVPSVVIDGFDVDVTCFRIGREYDHSEQMVI
ncbi:MAG: FAD-binding oxidoreductase [Alphaproteobacteria bacterium]|nr:FAD-binding oxidoreductase [Alphaproteobacteria bacterium]